MDLVTFCTWEYEYMIPPHAALLDRYGPGMGMIVYGDRQEGELPDNVEFRRAPHLKPDQDWDWAEDDWGPRGGFGVGFRACMEEIGEPVVAFTFPDFWPISDADDVLLDDMAAYVAARPNVVRVQVAAERGGESFRLTGNDLEAWRGTQMATIPAKDNHLGGFHWYPSLWNVPLLLGFLIPGCSHWGFEKSHHEKMFGRPDLMSCWPREVGYEITHVHDRKEPGANLQYLEGDDLEIAVAHLRPGVQYYRREHGWKTC